MITSIILAILLVSIFVVNYIRNTKIEKEHQKTRLRKIAQKKEYCEYLISCTKSATTLEQLLSIHKLADALNLTNKNLKPDSFGMFRTKDIITMNSSDVYLGNINGLWTNTMSYWETKRNTEDYQIVFDQYLKHLVSNLTAIKLSL